MVLYFLNDHILHIDFVIPSLPNGITSNGNIYTSSSVITEFVVNQLSLSPAIGMGNNIDFPNVIKPVTSILTKATLERIFIRNGKRMLVDLFVVRARKWNQVGSKVRHYGF